jgi:pimeloyl-ACP methyl ester carboxylesterase
MTARLIRANGVDLCAETFGDPGDPAILLVMGAAASMLYWEAEFCERLAAGGRFVVRYDHRDTGRSTSYEPGAPPYSLRDLEADALGLLDALGLARAHLVGMSMGGSIAQLIALDHPERVASLTLLSSTPGGPGHEYPDLPATSADLAARFSEPAPEPDWADREAVIEYHVESERAFAGSLPFDEAHWRDLAGRSFDRTANVASSMANHFLIDPGPPWRQRLGSVAVPTLIVHGSDDPLFPVGHAHAMRDEIPGAELLVTAGMGHEVPPPAVWDEVVPAILRHTGVGRP